MQAVFAQLRGRIGAARLSLGTSVLGSELHTCQSKLQANAVKAEVSKDAARVLTPDERSKLSDMVLAANFTSADAVSIMEALTQPDGKKQRAASQDHVAFLGYLSANEWDVAVTGVEAATQVFLNALVHRETRCSCIACVCTGACRWQCWPDPGGCESCAAPDCQDAVPQIGSQSQEESASATTSIYHCIACQA